MVIIASRFNEALTDGLVRGAQQTLRQAGVDAVQVCWVPGAFELPAAAARIAQERPDAIIAVGVIRRGRTPQYLALAHAVLQALAMVSVTSRVPVTCGVVVAQTLAQALARTRWPAAARRRAVSRSKSPVANRGAEAAAAALELVETLDQRAVKP